MLSACAGAASALAAPRSKHPRHGVRCRHAGKRRGKAGSFHASHRPKRGCPRGPRHKRTHHKAPLTHSAPVNSSALSGYSPCPDTGLRPTVGNLELIRTATICLVNRERIAHGETPLRENSKLGAAAQGHAESMAWGNYFEHMGPGGQTPLDRMRAAGYVYGSIGFEVGENIAWGTGRLGTPNAIVAAWMGDPGHRANILDAHFHDTAIGISPHVPDSLGHGQSGGIYTQDFGVITS
ncbi:MAG TPA: CAP domain-containing protein [Solirubrobacteraceae bacterium]|nr:CAP domain-containing protein [Solirubrobacteraceae bacterium]